MITATSVPSPNALRRWPASAAAADYHLYAPASGTGDRSGKGDALGRLTGWSRPGRPIRIKFPRYASRRACQRSISTCRALSPSVISDNYGGAALTHKITANSARRRGELAPLTFIGGRSGDHNTSERLRGFHDAHRELGLSVPQANILAPGYSKATLRPVCRSGLAARRRCCRGYLLTRRYPRKGCALAVAGGSDRQRAAADGLLRLGSFCLPAGARY